MHKLCSADAEGDQVRHQIDCPMSQTETKVVQIDCRMRFSAVVLLRSFKELYGLYIFLYRSWGGNKHSKKYQNFPIVLGWKFKGNGQVPMGNLRETEISISPFGKLWEMSPFPQNFPSKKCGEISSFFAVKASFQ